MANSQVTSLNLEKKNYNDWKQVAIELKNYPNLQLLSLKGNYLEKIGKDIGKLKKLKYLDISDNAIETVEDVLEGLMSLAALKEIKIDLATKREEELLLKALPKLQFLNGAKLREEGDAAPQAGKLDQKDEKSKKKIDVNGEQLSDVYFKEFLEEYRLKQTDYQKASVLFDCVRSLQEELNPDGDTETEQVMRDHIKLIDDDINASVKGSMHPFIKAMYNLKGRFALYEPVVSRQLDYLNATDKRSAQILSELHDIHKWTFKALIEIIENLEGQLNKVEPTNRSKSAKNLKEGWDQTGDKSKNGAGREIGGLEQEIDRLKEEMAGLEKENQKYLKMLVKNSKDKAEQVVEATTPVRTKGENEGYKVTAMDMRNVRNNNIIEDTNYRMLTIKQTTELIEAIYESKLKCDQKYIESKLPRETMEQHMYTFLNTKYGLKSLIIEWATAIINSIKRFNAQDNDIAVFGLILRNECDEEFRFVQTQVKSTIRELLKMLIKGKYPYKNKQELQELVQTKTEGYLAEDEVHEIARYMYSKDDSDMILAAVRAQLSRGAHLGKDRRLTREERYQVLKEQEKKRIRFSAVEKIILDFQLKSHENFLEKFKGLFKQVDKDQNGIVDENEFRELAKTIDTKGNLGLNIDEMLDVLDPFSNDIITFSSIVTLFSSVPDSYEASY